MIRSCEWLPNVRYRVIAAALIFLALLWAIPLSAQNPQTQSLSVRPDYTLGANDQILIRTVGVEELKERPFRVDSEGFLTLPVVGKVKAAGLTVQALEAELVKLLQVYVREPQVSISVVQFRSDPVFIIGAFRAPGIYALQGRKTLVEMLSSVGGLLPNASRRIRVTRKAEYGRLDLPNAVENAVKKTSTAEISIESLTQDVNPASDILLQPYDIISAERAERIYVSGEVGKVSAIELGERESVSILQALTEAGGMGLYAVPTKVRILRPVLGTTRRSEIVVDVKRMLEGKDLDLPLQPNDVLYVPRSGLRSVITPASTGILTSLPVVIVTLLLR